VNIVAEGEENVKRTVTVNIASLPLMFQYFATRNYFIEAGPQLSFITSVIDEIPGKEKMNIKRSFANTQFGLNIGMGLMAGKKVQLYARYCFGFTDLTRFDDNADYSRVLQAGFLFRLK
jgi:outer membrane immunogenic protein